MKTLTLILCFFASLTLCSQETSKLKLMFDEGEYNYISNSLESKDGNYMLFKQYDALTGAYFLSIYSKNENNFINKGFFNLTLENLEKYNFPKFKLNDYEECHYFNTWSKRDWVCYGTSYMEHMKYLKRLNNGYVKLVSFDSISNYNMKKIITQLHLHDKNEDKPSSLDTDEDKHWLTKNANYKLMEINHVNNNVFILYNRLESMPNNYWVFDNNYNMLINNDLNLNEKFLEKIYYSIYINEIDFLTNDYCFTEEGNIYQLDVEKLKFNRIHKAPINIRKFYDNRYQEFKNDMELNPEVDYKYNQFKTTNFKFFKTGYNNLIELTDTKSFANNNLDSIITKVYKLTTLFNLSYIDKDFALSTTTTLKAKSWNDNYLVHNFNKKNDTIKFPYNPTLYGISKKNRYVFIENSLYDLKLNELILDLNYYFYYTQLYPIFNDDESIVMMPRNEFQYEIFDIHEENRSSYGKAKKIADYYYYSEDEWYLITPEGYYDKSNSSSDRIYWVYDDKEIYDLENFPNKYKPGLLDIILKGEYNVSENSLIDNFENDLPPKIETIDFDEDTGFLSYRLDKRNHKEDSDFGDVYINIHGQDYLVSAFHKETTTVEGSFNFNPEHKDKCQKTKGCADYSDRIRNYYIDSINQTGFKYNYIKLKVSSSDKNYFNTSPIYAYKYFKPVNERVVEDNKPNFYGLFIGVNKTQNNPEFLKWSKRDATTMGSFVEKSAEALGIYKEVNCAVLTDDNTTLENINAQIDRIKLKINKFDVFMLYISGHGIGLKDVETANATEFNNNNEEAYFIPTYDLDDKLNRINISKDQNTNEISSDEALTGNDLKNIIRSLQSNKNILIVDACFSGNVIEELKRTKGDDTTTDQTRQKQLQSLNVSSGTLVITASSSQERARESNDYQHSLLTYAMLNQLNEIIGRKDIGEYENKLYVRNWFDGTKNYFRKNLKSTEGEGLQTPKVYYPKTSDDFFIGDFSETLKNELDEHLGVPLITITELYTEYSINRIEKEIAITLRNKLEKLSLGKYANLFQTDFRNYEQYGNTFKLIINLDDKTIEVTEYSEENTPKEIIPLILQEDLSDDNIEALTEEIINKLITYFEQVEAKKKK